MGTIWRTRMVHRTSHISLQIPWGIHPKNKSGTDIWHSILLPHQIFHARYFMNICCHSCHARSNSGTAKSSTCQPTSHTRKYTQSGVEIPVQIFLKNKPPHQYLWGCYRQNRINPSEKSVQSPMHNIQGCQLMMHTQRNSNRWTQKTTIKNSTKKSFNRCPK